jgi:zinc protease
MTRKKNGIAFVEDIPFGAALSVRRWKLANGLDVMVLADRSAPVVSYQTWFRVGSRHEQPGKTGLAHFFEHLMFKETKNVGPGEFDRLMESVGGETNAATWTDWTAYYENLPKREIELAARLEADRMQNLVLQEPPVESEREVVINERKFRVEDDVEGTTNERLYATAFKKHPYRWPTIGWMKDIRAYTVDDCLAFYRTYYAPNNATLVIAGDVDEKDVVGLVRRHYGAISSSRVPAEKRVAEPNQRSERVLELEQPTDTEKIALGWRAPEFGSRDYAVLTVMNDMLTGGRSSRLYRALVSDGEIASEVHGSIAPFHDPGLYELWSSARPGITARALLRVIERELARIVRDRPGEAELEKAKNRLELSFLHGMETVSGKADQIGFHAVVTGDVGGVFLQLEDWRSVTVQDVQAAARRYLDRQHRTTISVLPQRGARA